MDQQNNSMKVLLIAVLFMLSGSFVTAMNSKIKYLGSLPDIFSNAQKLKEQEQDREFLPRNQVIVSAPQYKRLSPSSPSRLGVAYLLAQQRISPLAIDSNINTDFLTPSSEFSNTDDFTSEINSSSKQTIELRSLLHSPSARVSISQFDIRNGKQVKKVKALQTRYKDPISKGFISIEDAMDKEKQSIKRIKQNANLNRLSIDDIEKIMLHKKTIARLEYVKKEKQQRLKEEDQLARLRAKERRDTVSVSQSDFVPRLGLTPGNNEELLRPYTPFTPRTAQEITTAIVTADTVYNL